MIHLATFIALILLTTASGILVSLGHAEESKFGTPKGDEGTRIFKAPEHPFTVVNFDSKVIAPSSSEVWAIRRPGIIWTMRAST